MRRQYQIDRQRAVRRFHKQAEESEQQLQLNLPLKEVAAALQEGVGHLMRQAGLELMQLIMDNEVRHLAGERYQRRGRSNHFAGDERTAFWLSMGRRFPSSVRDCVARKDGSNVWEATNRSAVPSRSMLPFGTS